MSKPRLLIVDDGDAYAELAHALLQRFDYTTRCELAGPCWTCPHREGCTLTHAHDWAETEQALGREEVDAVLLDLRFDVPIERLSPSSKPELSLRQRQEREGLEILKRLRRKRPDLPVILMTSVRDIALEDERDALSADELLTIAGDIAFDAVAIGGLVDQAIARRAKRAPSAGTTVWGGSTEMSSIRRRLEAVARTSLPQLLLGETGTGKTHLAKELHRLSGAKGAFVHADLSAIPKELVSAELFGSVRGAFSGAVDREGLLEQADGGTLLLDEVGNLPPATQRLLLVAVEERQSKRLGSTKSSPLDVKLVAATNADLWSKVEEGEFRADLLARLNPAAALTLPPLRDRSEDILPLTQRFAAELFQGGRDRALADEYIERAGLEPAEPRAIFGDPHPARLQFAITPGVARLLRKHPWPGNLRELRLVITTACASALADALQRGASEHVLPISTKQVQELLQRPASVRTKSGSSMLEVELAPSDSLRNVSRSVETQIMRALYKRYEGDFSKMARALLGDESPQAARKVRLRFNQLGLRVRKGV